MGSSKKLSGKLLESYKSTLALTKFQQDVLVGTVLGDANIRFFKKGANLTISHSEKQLDYVLWKYDVFRDWVLTEPKRGVREYYKDRNRNLVLWKFSTASHSILGRYYHMFYQNGKKGIPDEIESLLVSPLALAVWFMDDGSRKPYGRGAFLHTQSFSIKDQKKLIKVLKKNFSVEARLSSAGLYKGKRYYRLYITAGSFPTFRNLVLPYLLDSMRYKVSL
ncbi:hypothetical protein ISR94_02485 [Candidatus Microgenomates bacterium]|nr:hypothetical protein [Candidatus Microgenomates bacterium]